MSEGPDIKMLCEDSLSRALTKFLLKVHINLLITCTCASNSAFTCEWIDKMRFYVILTAFQLYQDDDRVIMNCRVQRIGKDIRIQWESRSADATELHRESR